jgi:hypothetical protein
MYNLSAGVGTPLVRGVGRSVEVLPDLCPAARRVAIIARCNVLLLYKLIAVLGRMREAQAG